MTYFANPWAFWLLPLLPALATVALLAGRRRRRALARLGNVAAVLALASRRRGLAALRGLCVFAGLAALVLGIAGPQWGRDYHQAVATGRDLVVLLDLSRSMLAQDVLPSRVERCKKAIADLSHVFQQRGGHRLALVIFAARAKIVCPLTHDYAHFRLVLERQDPNRLAPELRPRTGGPTSGTRLGAGLKMAVKACRQETAGPGLVLLLSDGDDPARDEEWRAGAEEARKLHVPVFAVGVGDPSPKTPVRIPVGDDFVRHDDVPVETKLEEKPLQEIARITRGTYIGARTSPLDLGALFRAWIEPRALRSADTDLFPAYVPRYPWFFGAALVLFSTALLIGQRPRRPAPEPLPPERSTREAVKAVEEAPALAAAGE